MSGIRRLWRSLVRALASRPRRKPDPAPKGRTVTVTMG